MKPGITELFLDFRDGLGHPFVGADVCLYEEFRCSWGCGAGGGRDAGAR
jgi:hypothetical protein